MRINKIELKNFRSHRDTKIVMLERVNYFLGLNGAGKSSIVDAIAYAMAGVCRGTDEGGRNADLLVSENAEPKQFAVALETTAGMISRVGPGNGPKSQVQENINKMLKLSPIVSRALVDVTHFFDLDATGQKAVLERVLDLTVDPAAIQAACGKDWPLAQATIPTPVENYADLLAAEKVLRSTRTALKATAPDQPAKPDLTTFPVSVHSLGVGEAQTILAPMQKKLRGLYEEKGKMDAVSQGAVDNERAMIREIEKTKKKIAELTAALDAIGDPRPKILRTVEEIARLSDAVGNYSPTGSSDNAQQAAGFIRMLDEAKEKCPVCLRPFGVKHKQNAITQHEQTRDMTERQIDLTGQSLSENLEKAKLRLTALEADEEKKAAIAADIRWCGEHVLNLKGQISSVQIQKSPGPPPELLARIEKGEYAVEQTSRYITVMETYEKAGADYRAYLKKTEAMDKLVEVFGPKGVRVKLIEGKLTAFLELANGFMKAFGFELKIEMEPFTVYVNGRRTVMLSETERLRAGVALQMALSERAGLKFVVIDQVDSLDLKSRPGLEALMEKADGFQFLLFGTPKADPATMTWPVVPGRGFWHVNMNGGHSTVERKT